MKTPSFWQRRGWLAILLLPLSMLYALAQRLRNVIITPAAVNVPVICIGNMTAGGAGKTPVALAIGKMLKERGINGFFLSRGYGGDYTRAMRVHLNQHTAKDVGDEPLLLAQTLPTIVARDRVKGARVAIESGAQAIIMDDGFQNPSLKKNLSLLVIDSHSGIGNGWLLPAGPLREPVAGAFARAGAIVVIGDGTRTPALPAGKPVLTARIVPKLPAHDLAGKKVYAFCGIAYPAKFFATLKTLGAIIVGSASYGDHYAYTSHDIVTLAAYAKAENAQLVTTEKDATRISPELKSLVTVVEIELVFDNPQALNMLLDKALAS